jgi:hypothetical protein
MIMNAVARKEGLTVESLRQETLVYDERNSKAHCLNRTVAAVWGYCDGNTSIPQMVDRLRLEVDPSLDEAVVRMALEQLAGSDLLEMSATPPADLLSRREVGRSLSAHAAVLLPMISSMAMPPAAAARSEKEKKEKEEKPEKPDKPDNPDKKPK